MAANFLTARELQEILHVDRTTIYRMADAGRLPAVKVGTQWRFPRRQMEEWLSAQMGGQVPALFNGAPHRNTVAHSLPPAAPPAETLPLESIQLIQDTFADALGIMIVVTNLEGRPLTRSSNPCGLLRVVEAQEDAYMRCLQWWAEMARRPAMQPAFIRSPMELLCARAFFRVGSELRGMVIFGGVAPQEWPPSGETVARTAQLLGLEAATFGLHLDEVYTMDGERERRLLDFVQRVADIITQLLSEQTGGEQPAPAHAAR